MKIGLALSGGGFRATVFHLGVLARLAEDDLLKDVQIVSTVSGGSLCAALLFASSDNQWPTSSHLIEKIIPRARTLIAARDMQLNVIRRFFKSPLDFLTTRADDLAEMLSVHWGVHGKVSDLPASPRWLINATCYETGKNWRFEKNRMGDFQYGFSQDTNFPLRRAVASSCGFPGLIGALPFDASPYKWFKYADGDTANKAENAFLRSGATQSYAPDFTQLHLWDGGAYDNLGVEGVMDIVGGWRQGIDFVMVSDAATRAKVEQYKIGMNAAMRIIVGVMMDQILELRMREVRERIDNHKDRGVYLRVDTNCARVLGDFKRQDIVAAIAPQCLSDTEAQAAADTETTLRKFTPIEFDRLFRQGFEVADYTLHASYPQDFKFVGYLNSRWGKR